MFIHKGSAVVRLGERELVVHEGGTVFIPRNVRITLTLDTYGRHIQRTGHDHVVAALDKLVR